jgi:hypothetical protein
MIAVTQHRTADPCKTRVDGVQAIDRSAADVIGGYFVFELAQQFSQNLLRLLIVAVHNVQPRLLQHMKRAAAGPRSHSDIGGIEEAHGVETHHLRIDPAVHRDIGRPQSVGLRLLG